MKRQLMVGIATVASLMATAPLGAVAATAPTAGGHVSAKVRKQEDPGSVMHVSDLNKRTMVMPSQFVITETARVAHVRWLSWGALVPEAVGTLEINTCEPNCAQGGNVRDRRAKLELRGSKKVNGVEYYTEYRVVLDKAPAKVRREYGKWSTTYVPS